MILATDTVPRSAAPHHWRVNPFDSERWSKSVGPSDSLWAVDLTCHYTYAAKSCLEVNAVAQIDPWLSVGVFVSTAATDAVYVLFNAAVSAKRRIPAATWSSVWYLLSAFAVISYTKNWAYVGFAAAGSWVGAFLSMTMLGRSHGSRARP
jgi:hypothetical protein